MLFFMKISHRHYEHLINILLDTIKLKDPNYGKVDDDIIIKSTSGASDQGQIYQNDDSLSRPQDMY